MQPAWYNLKWHRGGNLFRRIYWKDSAGNPVDVIGKTATLKIGHLDEAAIVTRTTSNDITLGASGMITLNVENSNLTSLVDDRYFYQLNVTLADSNTQVVMEGYFICGGQVE